MDNLENMENMAQEKPYTLRRLKDSDLWPVLDIIGKVMPDQFTDIMAEVMQQSFKVESEADVDKLIEHIGSQFVAKLAMNVLRNMNTVHDEVYAFLSSVSGIPADEIPEMGFGTTPRMLWDIVKNEANADFFKVVSKLL